MLRRTNIIQQIIIIIFSLIIPVSGKTDNILKIDLEKAIRIGVTNHFALQAIKDKIKAKRKLITERWREFLPSVGISYQHRNEVSIGLNDSRLHEIKLSIEQIIYDGGRRKLDLDLARLEELLTRDEFDIIYNNLRLKIQEAYLKVLAASGKLKLNNKSLQRAKVQLYQARREKKLGFTTRFQVMNIASKVEQIKLAFIKAQNENIQSMHDLKHTLNLDYMINLEVEGDIFEDFLLKPEIPHLNDMISEARNKRPEVLKSQVNLTHKRKILKLEENYWIPKISISSHIGRSGEQWPVQDQSWGIDLKVTMPFGGNTNNITSGYGRKQENSKETRISENFQIMNDMSHDRKIIESKSQYEEAVYSYNTLLQTIAIEVNKAHDNLLEAWESIKTGTNRVYFQYESLRLMNTRYKVGEVKRSDILFEETELVKAQEELTDAIARYLVTVYQLERAMGLPPGTLGLFKHEKGIGNSILTRIIKEDYKKFKKKKKHEDSVKMDEFLLDSIKIDEEL